MIIKEIEKMIIETKEEMDDYDRVVNRFEYIKKFIKENVKSKNVIVGKFGDTDIDVSQTVSDANYKITLTIEKSGEDEEDEKNEYTKE